MSTPLPELCIEAPASWSISEKHCNSAVFCRLDAGSSCPSINISDSEEGCSVSLDFSSAILCFKQDLTFSAVPTWLKHLSLNFGSSAVLNVSISLDSVQAYRCFQLMILTSPASSYEHQCSMMFFQTFLQHSDERNYGRH